MPAGGRGGAGGVRGGRGAGAAAPARRGAGGRARAAHRPLRPLRRRRALRHLHAARPQPQQGDRARLLHVRRLLAYAGTYAFHHIMWIFESIELYHVKRDKHRKLTLIAQ